MSTLTDVDRKMLFRCQEKLREAKNMLAAFGVVVRGPFGGSRTALEGTELHSLVFELDKLGDAVGELAMRANKP